MCKPLSRTRNDKTNAFIKAMYTALNELGYKTYHAIEIYPNLHQPYWRESLKAKITGEGKVYGRLGRGYGYTRGYRVTFGRVPTQRNFAG
jgi:hypothetical protein